MKYLLITKHNSTSDGQYWLGTKAKCIEKLNKFLESYDISPLFPNEDGYATFEEDEDGIIYFNHAEGAGPQAEILEPEIL